MKYQIENTDCLEGLKNLEDETVDLTLTSPPYCIGKAYDVHTTIAGFIEINEPVIKEIYRVTKNGGSICWQVGHHVQDGEVFPLDFYVYEIFKRNFPDIKLRNRVIWHFEHGANCRKRFSGRHETILWFTKGRDYYFDLDAVRVPQKYPGKKHYKGNKKGEYSCNPLGKNPGDVWIIPNVKANHIEKTLHPCQFPVALGLTLIKALAPEGGVVLDPFMGSGTTGAAAALSKRNFIGYELEKSYFEIARERIELAANNELRFRPENKDVYNPENAGKVAVNPFERIL